jgi:AraC-like DNA-binding protein
MLRKQSCNYYDIVTGNIEQELELEMKQSSLIALASDVPLTFQFLDSNFKQLDNEVNFTLVGDYRKNVRITKSSLKPNKTILFIIKLSQSKSLFQNLLNEVNPTENRVIFGGNDLRYLDNSLICSATFANRITKVMSQIVQLNHFPESSQKERLYELKLEEILLEIMGCHWWNRLHQFYLEFSSQSPIESLLNEVEANIGDKWTLEKMSAFAEITPTTLNRIFLQEIGVSPISFLNYIRINRAKELLMKNIEVNIAEIGYMVGFQDPTYFSKIFKQNVGITPSNFRKRVNSL